MTKWAIGRMAAGVVLIVIGATALLRFDLFQARLIGLSADGIVLPHSWLALRTMLIGCTLAGVTLLGWNAVVRLFDRLQATVSRIGEPAFVAGVLCVAAILRTATVLVLPFHRFGDYLRYDELGIQWAATGSYSDGALLTAFWPPGLPFFLSRLYLVFGHVPHVGIIANIVFSVGIVYLAYRLTRVALGEPAARLTAVGLALFPSQLWFVNLLCSEVPFTFLFLSGLYLWVKAARTFATDSVSPDLTPRVWGGAAVWAALAGITMGCATLVRTIALFAPLVVLAAYACGRRLNRRLLGGWGLLAAGMLVVLVPWIVRNIHAVGHATLATNSGLNFYIGNNPNSAIGYHGPDADVLPADDEALSDRLGYRLGWEFIRSNPVGFVRRGTLKTGFFMGSDTEGFWYHIIDASKQGRFDRYIWLAVFTQGVYLSFLLFFAVGLYSILRGWRSHTAELHTFVFLIIYWIGVHAVFFGDGRFRFPVMPLMIGVAAMGIMHLVNAKRLPRLARIES